MGEQTPWSPWRHLREHWPNVTIYEMDLPDGFLGFTNYTDSIWLTTGLGCAEQRCTLAHEIGHLERGPLPAGATPGMQAAEEADVDRWAARRLVDMRDLLRAFAWSRHLPEIAEELWIDQHTLRTRLRCLTDDEQDAIMSVLAKQHGAV